VLGGLLLGRAVTDLWTAVVSPGILPASVSEASPVQ
jgi:hypothetical protein